MAESVGLPEAALALEVAQACVPAPAQVSAKLAQRVVQSFQPAEAVELFSWLSVLAMLQRLYLMYVPDADRAEQ